MRSLKIAIIIILAVVALAYSGTEVSLLINGGNDAPVISCDSDFLEISVSDDEQVLLAGVTASDAQDGDITSEIRIAGISKFVDTATTKVTYLVFDSDHNVGRLTRTVHYSDYTPPRITITQPLIYSSIDNITLLDRILVEDSIDGDITGSVRLSKLTSTAENYIYTVNFRVANSMDDTVQLTLPVVRYPDNLNRPELRLTSCLIYLEQGSHFDPADYLSYIRTGDSIINKTEAKISGTADTSVPGTYMIRYSYSVNGVEGISVLTVVVE